MWSMACVAVGAVIVGLGIYAVVRMGRRGEQGVRDALDAFVAGEVGRVWARRRGDVEVERWVIAVETRGVEAAVRRDFHAHIRAVEVVFERSEEEGYLATVWIETPEGQSRASRVLAFDDLPEPVQDAMLRGDDEARVAWRPAFDAPVAGDA